jgi:hypothetical protein
MTKIVIIILSILAFNSNSFLRAQGIQTWIERLEWEQIVMQEDSIGMAEVETIQYGKNEKVISQWKSKVNQVSKLTYIKSQQLNNGKEVVQTYQRNNLQHPYLLHQEAIVKNGDTLKKTIYVNQWLANDLVLNVKIYLKLKKAKVLIAQEIYNFEPNHFLPIYYKFVDGETTKFFEYAKYDLTSNTYSISHTISRLERVVNKVGELNLKIKKELNKSSNISKTLKTNQIKLQMEIDANGNWIKISKYKPKRDDWELFETIWIKKISR